MLMRITAQLGTQAVGATAPSVSVARELVADWEQRSFTNIQTFDADEAPLDLNGASDEEGVQLPE